MTPSYYITWVSEYRGRSHVLRWPTQIYHLEHQLKQGYVWYWADRLSIPRDKPFKRRP